MNRDESSYENGRYVWAAIVIILAVVLAAIAFISWIVNSGKNNTATQENGTARYTTTNTEGRNGMFGDYSNRSTIRPNGDYYGTNPAVNDYTTKKANTNTTSKAKTTTNSNTKTGTQSKSDRVYSAGTLSDRDTTNGNTRTNDKTTDYKTNTNNPSGK